MGGKRGARRNFAASQTGIAYWEAEIARQNLYYELVVTFIEVYQSQEKLKIAEERLAIVERTIEIVEAQVKAGKVSPIQRRKAQISLKSAQVALREAISQLLYKQRNSSLRCGEVHALTLKELFLIFLIIKVPFLM